MQITLHKSDKTTPYVRKDNLPFVVIMMGAFRNIAQIPLFLNVPAHTVGLLWFCSPRKISKFLIPSYCLFGVALISLVYNMLPFENFARLLMVLGGIGIAEYISRFATHDVARFISKHLVWYILAATIVEGVFIATGFGERTRVLNESLSGGILPGIGIGFARFLGVSGGSGYSACLTGALALICYAEKFKRSALVLLIVSFLMISRGPILGMIMAASYIKFRKVPFSKMFAFLFPAGLALSPVIVAILLRYLDNYQISFLIEVSTRRFLHYMSFLHFGLENPLLGVGYNNYMAAYLKYAHLADFTKWGFTGEHLLKEAHNFMLDIFGELGIIAYALAAIQVFLLGFVSLRGDAKFAPVVIYISVCYAFLSGLSNWTYWIVVGVVLSHWRNAANNQVAYKSKRSLFGAFSRQASFREQ